MYIKNSSNPVGRWIDISANPIKNAGGKVLAGAIIFKDVSESVQALEQMSSAGGGVFEDSEDISNSEYKAFLTHFAKFRGNFSLLAKAVQETDDSIIITDAAGTIIYVNSGFEKRTGYSRHEALGQTPNILKSGHHDQTFYKDLWGKISGGEHFRGTILNKKKNGDTYWSEQTITPIKNDVGEITNYVSVLKDITDLIERERLEAELELAAEIQMSILPENLPTIPDFNLGAIIDPARQVSGDFYDVIPISENKVGILIGDVVDKGVTAAIMMARVHALIASEASRSERPGDILREVNDRLAVFDRSLQFTTAIYGILDLGKGEFAYARAGHEPPFLISPDGNPQHLPYEDGMALGILPEIVLDERTISIPPGGTLLLFTDGLVDCCNSDGDSFGYEGIQNTLSGLGGKSAQEVCDGIMEKINSYQKNEDHYDDITLVAVQANSD
jgi:sigma-B regulation protein RsbU (phosphoserine phosphatase)